MGIGKPITDVVIGGFPNRRMPVPLFVEIISNQLKLRAERWMARYPLPPSKPRVGAAGIIGMLAFAAGGAHR